MQMAEQFLFWCMVINIGLLTFIFFLVTLFKPLVLKIHSTLFGVPEDYVAKAMHVFLSVYKLLVFFFNVIPWIALRIIGT